MRDQQHAAARVREGAEIIERANGQVKVQARRWLVRYDHARVVHKRAAQKHATSHTARQLVRIQARHLGVQPVTLEQLLPTRAALGLRQPVREPFHLLAHAHHGVKVAHALRHQRQPVPAQRRKPRRVHALPIEPDAARYGGVRLEQPEHGIGQKRFARPRCAHHGHHLARVHRDAEVVQHLDVTLLGAEERLRFVIHAEAHAQVFHLQQMVPSRMMRVGCMRMMMMHLRIFVRRGFVRCVLVRAFGRKVARTFQRREVLCGAQKCFCIVAKVAGIRRFYRFCAFAKVCGFSVFAGRELIVFLHAILLHHVIRFHQYHFAHHRNLLLRRVGVNQFAQVLPRQVEQAHRAHKRHAGEHRQPPGARGQIAHRLA